MFLVGLDFFSDQLMNSIVHNHGFQFEVIWGTKSEVMHLNAMSFKEGR